MALIQRILVSLFLAVTFFIASAMKTCPRGWINFSDKKCFFISRTARSHEKAMEYCLVANSELSTLDAINSLKAIMRGNSIEKRARPTISSEVPEWIWIAKDSVDSSITSSSSPTTFFENDEVQESNNGSLTGMNERTDEICWILSTLKNEPRAVTCLHKEFHFICETPLNMKSNNLFVPSSRKKREVKSCPVEWNDINSKCYKAIKSRNGERVCQEKFSGSKRVAEEEMESILKMISDANVNSVDNGKSKNKEGEDKDVKLLPTVSNPAFDDCPDSGQAPSKTSPCVMVLCEKDLLDYNSNGSQLTNDTQIKKLLSPDGVSNHVNYGFKYKTMFAILLLCALATMTLATGGVVMAIKKAIKEQRRRKCSLQFENVLFDVDTVGKVEQEFTFHDLPNLA